MCVSAGGAMPGTEDVSGEKRRAWAGEGKRRGKQKLRF